MTDLVVAKSNSGLPLLLLLLFAAFLFLIVLPSRRRQRAARAQLSSLEPGQEVLTVGGLIGRVLEVGDQELKLELADGVVVRLARRGVATVLAPEEVVEDDELEPDDEFEEEEPDADDDPDAHAAEEPPEPDAGAERPGDPR